MSRSGIISVSTAGELGAGMNQPPGTYCIGGQAGFKAWPCLHMSDLIIEFILTLYVIPRVRFREHSILLSFSGRFWSLVADS